MNNLETIAGTSTIASTLRRLGAGPDAVAWSEPYGDDRERAWRECPNGARMLWLLGTQAGPPESEGRKKLVLAACACARLALPYAKGDAARVCIETAERWARGEATLDELRAARKAAYAACAADAYAAAAAYAESRVLRECADLVRAHYPDPPMVREE